MDRPRTSLTVKSHANREVTPKANGEVTSDANLDAIPDTHRRVCFHTLGCRTNVSDSSAMAATLVAAGFTLVQESRQADILVVNSCTVTTGADRDVGKSIRKAIRDNPHILVVVTGCLPVAFPRHDVLALAHLVIPGADSRLFAANLTQFLQDREARQPAHADLVAPGGLVPGPMADYPLEEHLKLSRYNLKIAQGCDQFCTYCIVPFSRGAPRSVPPRSVLARMESAWRAGWQEVVLTGTHLARWGHDLNPPAALEALMAQMEPVSRTACGDNRSCRIRLGSLEPDPSALAILQRMAAGAQANPRDGSGPFWCRHVHVAVQHGSDGILARMNRPYGFEEVARFIREAAQVLPGAAIGMDLIVGFPGETQDDFEQMLSRVRQLPFTYLHVFPFSPRPGTAAASMAEGVPVEQVKQRSARLRDLSRRRRQAHAAAMVGTHLVVLVERRRDPTGQRLLGLTDNYLRVQLEGPDEWMGTLVPCRVETAGAMALAVPLRGPTTRPVEERMPDVTS